MILAVETADIVHSTKLSEKVFEQLSFVLNDELESHQHKFACTYQRFRGDAHQVVYKTPTFAIRSAILTRLRLMFDVYEKSILLTQSLVVGKQDSNNTMGSVFVKSGRLLDDAKRGAFIVKIEQLEDIEIATMFLTDVLNNLTQKQAQALYWYIKSDFSEHKEVAKIIDTSRQNLSIHLSRSKAELVQAYINQVEFKIQEMGR